MFCLFFCPLDQAQCLAHFVTGRLNMIDYKIIHLRPHSNATSSKKLSLVPLSASTTLLLDSQSPRSFCFPFLGSFVLELTVHMSGTPFRCQLLDQA